MFFPKLLNTAGDINKSSAWVTAYIWLHIFSVGGRRFGVKIYFPSLMHISITGHRSNCMVLFISFSDVQIKSRMKIFKLFPHLLSCILTEDYWAAQWARTVEGFCFCSPALSDQYLSQKSLVPGSLVHHELSLKTKLWNTKKEVGKRDRW